MAASMALAIALRAGASPGEYQEGARDSASAGVTVEVAPADSNAAGAAVGIVAADSTSTSAVVEITAEAASPEQAGGSPRPQLSLDINLEVPLALRRMIERGTASEADLEAWAALPGQREILERGLPRQVVIENARQVVDGQANDETQPPGVPGSMRMSPRSVWWPALDRLESESASLAKRVVEHVAPYVPAGIEPPQVTAYFHLGGGWDARTTDAIYVNLSDILDTRQPSLEGVDALMARELMQAVVASGLTEFIDFGTPDAILLTGLQQSYNHGLTRLVERRLLRSVYPEGTYAERRVREYAALDAAMDESLRFFDRYVGTALRGDAAAAESLLVDGLRSGSLATVGELVCRTLLAVDGPAGAGAGLDVGPVAMFSTYQRVAASRSDLPDLPVRLVARLDAIETGLARPYVGAEHARREVFAAFDRSDYAAALTWLERVQEFVPGHPIDLYNMACALSRLGRLDEAMATLELSVAAGFRDAEHIRNDPDLAALRDRPDFLALLERLEGGTSLPAERGGSTPDDGASGERGSSPDDGSNEGRGSSPGGGSHEEN